MSLRPNGRELVRLGGRSINTFFFMYVCIFIIFLLFFLFIFFMQPEVREAPKLYTPYSRWRHAPLHLGLRFKLELN